MRTGEFALEGNVFLVEGEKYAIRERKKVKGKPKFYLIRCEPFQYVSSPFSKRNSGLPGDIRPHAKVKLTMAKHKRTEMILENAISVLADYHPMTVRQVYYRLVSRQIIDNNRSQYQAVSNILVDARKSGAIPWGWVEDRLRKPRYVSMWDNLAAFAHTAVHSYRLDVWATQPCYLECWLEKDALSGIFEQLLANYGVTLNVGRGYDGWDSIHSAAMRFGTGEGCTVLYYGDFDPSGEDMVRSLRERLAFFGCEPEIVKCALTLDDVHRYNLPPDFAKKTDTRAAAFIEKWGDMAVELDALPPDVLQTSLKNEVEKRMDMAALASVKLQERRDKAELLAKLE